MDERFVEIAQLLDGEAAHRQLDPLDEEQKSALADPAQCFAMLDDMEARCGMHVDVARIGLSKLHFYIRPADVAALEEAAEPLLARYKALGAEERGEVVHEAMAAGALVEYFDENTGGFVWLSHTIHAGANGQRLFVTAGIDSVAVYAVPRQFPFDEDCGFDEAHQLASHVAGMCGEDAHLLVASWFYGED